jgi:hypothetical protein
MNRPFFRRCGHAPGTLTPEDQAVVDAFLALLAARKNPQPWTPGSNQDIAVRIGPFREPGGDVDALGLGWPGDPCDARVRGVRKSGDRRRV